jgi:hypothetical protein
MMIWQRRAKRSIFRPRQLGKKSCKMLEGKKDDKE